MGTKGRGCDRKRRHDTKERAQLIRDTGVAPHRMVVYQCKFCSGWHVGHSSRSKQKAG